MAGVISEDENNDLTTDACPTPPRDESPKSTKKIPSGTEKEQIFTNGTHRYTKKTKIRKGPKSASVQMINIHKSTGIHIGDNITIMGSNYKPESFQNSAQNIEKTEKIESLLKDTRRVTEKDVYFISEHIGEGWRDTARLLNYSAAQIQRFHADFKQNGFKEVIIHFLLDWIQNEADHATVNILTNALWESNEKEAVLKLSEK